MSRSVAYQFLNAIDRCFKLGIDKHASGERGTGTIFSFADRRQLVDTSAQLGKFIEVHYGRMLVRDIKPHHIQAYIDSKVQTNRQASLDKLESMVNKLERVINKTYKSANVRWAGNIVIPASQIQVDTAKLAQFGLSKEEIQGIKEMARSITMPKEHYDLILKAAEGSKSAALPALKIAGTYGLRVSELSKLQARDVRISPDGKSAILHIHDSKGKHSRDIPIRAEDISFFRGLIAGKGPKDRLIPMLPDSINRQLARWQTKVKIQGADGKMVSLRDLYKEARTGIHSIRKMAATNLYDHLRNSGVSRADAIRYLNRWLGHGEDRGTEVLRYYVANLW